MSSTGPCCNCNLSLYLPCPEEKYQGPVGFCLHSLARTSPGLCLGVKSGVHHQAIDKHPKMWTSTCNSRAVLTWPSGKESKRITARMADWEAFQQAPSLRITRTWRGLTSWGLLLVDGQSMQQLKASMLTQPRSHSTSVLLIDFVQDGFLNSTTLVSWVPRASASTTKLSSVPEETATNCSVTCDTWVPPSPLRHQMHQPSRWVEPLWESIDSIASIADLWWCWWNSQRTPGKGWHQRYRAQA